MKKQYEGTHFGERVSGGFHETRPPPFPILNITFPFAVEVDGSETTGSSGTRGVKLAGGNGRSVFNVGGRLGACMKSAGGNSGSGVDSEGRLDACVVVL